jgi:PKHD-type hydroxylase
MFTSYRHPENKSPAYVIHNAFDSDSCYTIIERYKNNTSKATHVTKEGDLIGGINSTRDSNVAFISEPGVIGKIQEFIKVANHITAWNFDITMTEDIQFTKYGPEQHYSWHFDGFGDHHAKRIFCFRNDMPENPGLKFTSAPQAIDTVRKISASVVLNDDYSGGEFDTAWLDADDGQLPIRKSTFKPKMGDMIIFPSHIPHRVRPVRVGTRYSLVVWAGGPAFK